MEDNITVRARYVIEDNKSGSDGLSGLVISSYILTVEPLIFMLARKVNN